MSKKHANVSLIALVGLAALIPVSVWAQAYSSSLTGLVTDPSGAAVPAVELKLTDVNKGYDYTAQSNESGRYLLPFSPARPTVSLPRLAALRLPCAKGSF